jgi:hypothetical protein
MASVSLKILMGKLQRLSRSVLATSVPFLRTEVAAQLCTRNVVYERVNIVRTLAVT